MPSGPNPIQHRLGRYPDAAACYRRALALCRELGDQYHQAEVLAHLADTLGALGSAADARDARIEALGILDQVDHPRAQEVRAKLGLAGSECHAGGSPAARAGGLG